MNMYCDQYSVCNSMLLDQGSEQRNQNHARSKGWHLWSGRTLGGTQRTVVLCPRCVDSRRRSLEPAPERLEGQLDLFELSVRVGPEPRTLKLRRKAEESWRRHRLNWQFRLGRA